MGFRLTYLVMARDTMAHCSLPLHTPASGTIRGQGVRRDGHPAGKGSPSQPQTHFKPGCIGWVTGSILIAGFFPESSLQNPRSLCIEETVLK